MQLLIPRPTPACPDDRRGTPAQDRPRPRSRALVLVTCLGLALSAMACSQPGSTPAAPGATTLPAATTAPGATTGPVATPASTGIGY